MSHGCDTVITHFVLTVPSFRVAATIRLHAAGPVLLHCIVIFIPFSAAWFQQAGTACNMHARKLNVLYIVQTVYYAVCAIYCDKPADQEVMIVNIFQLYRLLISFITTHWCVQSTLTCITHNYRQEIEKMTPVLRPPSSGYLTRSLAIYLLFSVSLTVSAV